MAEGQVMGDFLLVQLIYKFIKIAIKYDLCHSILYRVAVCEHDASSCGGKRTSME
jgi:hypothetical protein